MIVKYETRAAYPLLTITRVEASSEENAYVVVDGIRRSKSTPYHKLHDTFEAAKQHYIDLFQAELDEYERRAAKAKSLIEQVTNMNEGDEIETGKKDDA